METATQPRASMQAEVIEEYALAMACGNTFPAIVLFLDEDEKACVGDGWYRVMAAKQAGLETIFAEVREGGKREAIWRAVAEAAKVHHETVAKVRTEMGDVAKSPHPEEGDAHRFDGPPAAGEEAEKEEG